MPYVEEVSTTAGQEEQKYRQSQNDGDFWSSDGKDANVLCFITWLTAGHLLSTLERYEPLLLGLVEGTEFGIDPGRQVPTHLGQ